jgi:hypothetical protein
MRAKKLAEIVNNPENDRITPHKTTTANQPARFGGIFYNRNSKLRIHHSDWPDMLISLHESNILYFF